MLFNPSLESTDERDLTFCRHSTLEKFRESPAYFKAYFIDKTIEVPEPSAQMRIGSAVDAMLLAPEKHITVIDNVLSKSTSKASMAKKKEVKSRLWLNQADYDTARRTFAAILAHPDSSAILAQPRESQKQVFWGCQWTEFPKRGTLDILTSSMIVDLKTTASWNLGRRRLSNHIFQSGHHRQLAMYQEGVEAAIGELLPTKLLYAGTDPPYEVVVIDVDGAELDLGWRENRAACLDLEEAYAYQDWTSRNKQKRAVFSNWALGAERC